MTNRELINELQQRCYQANANRAKMAYQFIADELLRQIPEAKLIAARPVDLLGAAAPAQLDAYSSADLFFYYFIALLPDGRAVKIRVDNSLARFRIYRLYWHEEPEPARYGHTSHMSYDVLVCNRSNSSLVKAINKLAAREPAPNSRAPTTGELNDYIVDTTYL